MLSSVFETEIRAWYGRYGVLASSVMIGLYAIALVEQRIAVQQLLIIFFAGYTTWILVSVWRCAESSAPFWRTLARSLTVAWAGNAILVLLFLQLGLIAGYFT